MAKVRGTKIGKIKKCLKNPKLAIAILALLLVSLLIYHINEVGSLTKDRFLQIYSLNPVLLRADAFQFYLHLYNHQFANNLTLITNVTEVDFLADLSNRISSNVVESMSDLESTNSWELYFCVKFKVFCPERTLLTVSNYMVDESRFFGEGLWAAWELHNNATLTRELLRSQIEQELQDIQNNKWTPLDLLFPLKEYRDVDSDKLIALVESDLSEFCSIQKPKFDEDMSVGDYFDAKLRIGYCKYFW